MKSTAIISIILFLPFFLVAQNSTTIKEIEKILGDVPMGLPLATFLEKHPNAALLESTDYRVEYTENSIEKGIKEITYYFGQEDNKPFYEVIVELADESLREEVSKKFFGEFNHPTIPQHWVLYKGDKDYLTVAWTYEAKFIYAGMVPKTSYFNDSMFDIADDFPKADKRIIKSKNPHFNPSDEAQPNNKKEEELNRNENDSYTIDDYNQALEIFFASNVRLTMPTEELLPLFPELTLNKKSPAFRNEYTVPVNNKGLKQIQFYTTTKEDNPLYEVIFEFENPDTVLLLAELMFAGLHHPRLENHWVLNIGEKNDNDLHAVSLAWVYDNRLILAGNLPNSELETQESFQFADDYILAYLTSEGLINPEEGNTEYPSENSTTYDDEATIENEATSLTINNLIAAATNDFDEYKMELMPNKKDEYNADAFIGLGQDQAVIRKSAAGNWRLELRFPSYSTAEDAKTVLDNTITFYQNLEGLEYRLVKKSDLPTTNGRTYIWDIQTFDDQSTGVILKWQTYPTSNGEFGIKMELGK
jgi:hypothetical protein